MKNTNSLTLVMRLVRASLRGQMRYPASALMLTLGQFLVSGLEILAAWALFHRFGEVQGWHIGELALIYGLVNCMYAIADVLGRGFDILGTALLRTGEFDRLLLRPQSLTLQLLTYDLRIGRLGRLLQGLMILALATVQADISWAQTSIAVALFSLAGGVALFLGILVLRGTLSFWTIESIELASVLSYGGVQASQYPLDLYARWFRYLLTFAVPLAGVAYYPALIILGKPDPTGAPAWTGLVSPLAGFAFLAVSFAAWRVGVRHYSSTGS
nr:ABC-2 family transporter protein [uncultured Cupriavidus sp.]